MTVENCSECGIQVVSYARHFYSPNQKIEENGKIYCFKCARRLNLGSTLTIQQGDEIYSESGGNMKPIVVEQLCKNCLKNDACIAFRTARDTNQHFLQMIEFITKEPIDIDQLAKNCKLFMPFNFKMGNPLEDIELK